MVIGKSPVRVRSKKVLKGQVPYGYQVGAYGQLEPQAEEQRVLERIVGMINELSLNEVARRLNIEGVPTKNGTRWHANTVRVILAGNPKNPFIS